MSSALVQTLIGGGLTIVGGLLAAWWQTSRSDNIAQKIRRAERYEGALIELNARVADTTGRVGTVWQTARSARLRGIGHKVTDASEYSRAGDPLRELLNYWQTASSLLISDAEIVKAFVHLHQETATRIWREGSVAYGRQPPQRGKVDTTQFLQDLEAVFVALSKAGKEVGLQAAALNGAHRSLPRAITARVRRR